MGLDMYLSANKYVGHWNHAPESEKATYRAMVAALGLPGFVCDGSPNLTVSVKVAYWRKANQIHKWFVDNVQEGEDDCHTHDVERSQLEELVSLCQKVLDSVETVDGDIPTGTTYYPDGRIVEEFRPGQVVAQAPIAEKLLPSASGFFFGSTNYDECYLQDLKETIEQLRAVLDNPALADFDFEYRSSW